MESRRPYDLASISLSQFDNGGGGDGDSGGGGGGGGGGSDEVYTPRELREYDRSVKSIAVFVQPTPLGPHRQY
ncbi:hypothetical protein HZH66_004093 [Vespula vulgaris]|uniref:Uncharacterized protein n=1 Tax=Vespula vulgaris TaxID=7454 RepID=A0A834KEJ0_VESVU|nr:hypothetical protein HZH66_004093 [Vespula vulgaris]